jgi:hypothetical protein
MLSSPAITGLSASNKKTWACSSMNCAINPASSYHSFVSCVDDDVCFDFRNGAQQQLDDYAIRQDEGIDNSNIFATSTTFAFVISAALHSLACLVNRVWVLAFCERASASVLRRREKKEEKREEAREERERKQRS